MADRTRWPCVDTAAMLSDPADAATAIGFADTAEAGVATSVTELTAAEGPWTDLEGAGYTAISDASGEAVVHVDDLGDKIAELVTVLNDFSTATIEFETDSDKNHSDAQAAFTKLEGLEGDANTLIGTMNARRNELSILVGAGDPSTAGRQTALANELDALAVNLAEKNDDIDSATLDLDDLLRDWDDLKLRERQMDTDFALLIDSITVPPEPPPGVTVSKAGPTVSVAPGQQVYVFEVVDPDTGEPTVIVTNDGSLWSDYHNGEDIDLDDRRVTATAATDEEITFEVHTSSIASGPTYIVADDGIENTINVNIDTDDTRSSLIEIGGDGFSGDVNVTGVNSTNLTVNTGGDVDIDDADNTYVTIERGDDVSIEGTGDNDVQVEEAGSVDIDITGSGDNEISITNVERSVDVSTEDGDQQIEITDAQTADVTTGEGDNAVSIDGIHGTVDVTAADGDQEVTITNSGAANVVTGNGNDTIVATDINSTVTVDGGGATASPDTNDDGDPIVELGGDTITIDAAGDVEVETGTATGDQPGITYPDGDPVEFADGKDVINVASSSGNVTVDSGDRRDEITVTDGIAAEVRGGSARDDIAVSGVTEANVWGGSGDDNIDTYGSERADVSGGSGDDYIRTGDGRDNVRGGAGFDTIYGGGGNDTLRGDGDNDYIDGGQGDDTIHGGAGNDILSGNHGDDILNGNGGDDTLVAGTGSDTVDGGVGSDRAHAQGDDNVTAERYDISHIDDNFDAETDLTRIEVDGDENFRSRTYDDLNTLAAINESAGGLQAIEGATSGTGEEHNLVIEEYDGENGKANAVDRDSATIIIDPDTGVPEANAGSNGIVRYNPDFNTSTDSVTGPPVPSPTGPGPAVPGPNVEGPPKPPIVVLYHELAHGSDYISGTLDDSDYSGPDANDNGSFESVNENYDPIKNAERDAVGLDPERGDGTRPADSESLHDDRLTERGLQEALGLPPRETYKDDPPPP